MAALVGGPGTPKDKPIRRKSSPGRNALPSRDADYEKYAKNGLTITIGESEERNENTRRLLTTIFVMVYLLLVVVGLFHPTRRARSCAVAWALVRLVTA
jgi:hypothetical protein